MALTWSGKVGSLIRQSELTAVTTFVDDNLTAFCAAKDTHYASMLGSNYAGHKGGYYADYCDYNGYVSRDYRVYDGHNRSNYSFVGS